MFWLEEELYYSMGKLKSGSFNRKNGLIKFRVEVIPAKNITTNDTLWPGKKRITTDLSTTGAGAYLLRLWITHLIQKWTFFLVTGAQEFFFQGNNYENCASTFYTLRRTNFPAYCTVHIHIILTRLWGVCRRTYQNHTNSLRSLVSLCYFPIRRHIWSLFYSVMRYQCICFVLMGSPSYTS